MRTKEDWRLKTRKQDLNSIIDTMQIRINFSDYRELNKISISSNDYVKSISKEIEGDGGYARIVLNLNRVLSHYNRLETLGEHNRTFSQVMKGFGIMIDENIKLERLDIAIDSHLDFDDNFKYFLYLFELITHNDKRADRWYTTNIDTLKQNSIKNIARSMDIVFYDKAEESEGRHLYNTRMEFRFKRLSKLDFESKLLQLIDLIKTIDINIPLINKSMSNRICRLYDKEIKKGSINNLSEFVRKYNDYIYTKEILEALYKHTGLKGTFNDWIKYYKKNNKLDLYTKTDIEDYKKSAIKSIKEYKKTDESKIKNAI